MADFCLSEDPAAELLNLWVSKRLEAAVPPTTRSQKSAGITPFPICIRKHETEPVQDVVVKEVSEKSVQPKHKPRFSNSRYPTYQQLPEFRHSAPPATTLREYRECHMYSKNRLRKVDRTALVASLMLARASHEGKLASTSAIEAALAADSEDETGTASRIQRPANIQDFSTQSDNSTIQKCPQVCESSSDGKLLSSQPPLPIVARSLHIGLDKSGNLRKRRDTLLTLVAKSNRRQENMKGRTSDVNLNRKPSAVQSQTLCSAIVRKPRIPIPVSTIVLGDFSGEPSGGTPSSTPKHSPLKRSVDRNSKRTCKHSSDIDLRKIPTPNSSHSRNKGDGFRRKFFDSMGFKNVNGLLAMLAKDKQELPEVFPQNHRKTREKFGMPRSSETAFDIMKSEHKGRSAFLQELALEKMKESGLGKHSGPFLSSQTSSDGNSNSDCDYSKNAETDKKLYRKSDLKKEGLDFRKNKSGTSLSSFQLTRTNRKGKYDDFASVRKTIFSTLQFHKEKINIGDYADLEQEHHSRNKCNETVQDGQKPKLHQSRCLTPEKRIVSTDDTKDEFGDCQDYHSTDIKEEMINSAIVAMKANSVDLNDEEVRPKEYFEELMERAGGLDFGIERNLFSEDTLRTNTIGFGQHKVVSSLAEDIDAHDNLTEKEKQKLIEILERRRSPSPDLKMQLENNQTIQGKCNEIRYNENSRQSDQPFRLAVDRRIPNKKTTSSNKAYLQEFTETKLTKYSVEKKHDLNYPENFHLGGEGEEESSHEMNHDWKVEFPKRTSDRAIRSPFKEEGLDDTGLRKLCLTESDKRKVRENVAQKMSTNAFRDAGTEINDILEYTTSELLEMNREERKIRDEVNIGAEKSFKEQKCGSDDPMISRTSTQYSPKFDPSMLAQTSQFLKMSTKK